MWDKKITFEVKYRQINGGWNFEKSRQINVRYGILGFSSPVSKKGSQS